MRRDHGRRRVARRGNAEADPPLSGGETASADAGPLRYLILIGQVDLLRRFGKVYVPVSVRHELTRPATPAVVRTWFDNPPSWLETVAEPRLPPRSSAADRLGPGERDAIEVALRLRTDVVLMDDRVGVKEAASLGLETAGTLGLLYEAALAGLVDLRDALAALRSTNFRHTPRLLDGLIERFDQQADDR